MVERLTVIASECNDSFAWQYRKGEGKAADIGARTEN